MEADLIETFKSLNWGKFLRNALIFGGPNLITALLAVQTNVLPQFIHNSGSLALVIIIENLIIDLVRKYIQVNG